jgi:hypothetical protein
MSLMQAVNHPLDCGSATTASFLLSYEKQRVNQRSFDLTAITVPRIVSGGAATEIAVGDSLNLRTEAALTANDYLLTLNSRGLRDVVLRRVIASNENVLRPRTNNPRSIEYIGNGSCVITAELVSGEKQVIGLAGQTSTPNVVDSFVSFIGGSLIKHIFDQTALQCAKNTSRPQHYSAFSTFNPATQSFTKNAGCWFDGDLSGVSVATAGGATRMCAAVTPWHALGVVHASFHPSIGETVMFVDNTGAVVTRTVEAVQYVGLRDCSVIKFTQALPDSVAKYPLLPADAGDFLPVNRIFYNQGVPLNLYSMYRCPIVAISHYIADPNFVGQRGGRFVYVRDVEYTEFLAGAGINANYSTWFPNHSGNFEGDTWLSPIRGGDSGGPQFVLINNQPILVGSHITPFSCLNLAPLRSEIQTVINALGPANQTLGAADLSAFTNFAN